MVIPRGASLLVEMILGGAAAIGFVAMMAGGSRAGRVARTVTLWGSVFALAAALATLGWDEEWLFGALRVDRFTQSLKVLVTVGLLITELRSQEADAFAGERTVQPFLRLVGAAALATAASAGDLLVMWIALDIASAAVVAAVATTGSWSTRETIVRRLVSVWLPASLLCLLGMLFAAAMAGTTRMPLMAIRLDGLWDQPAVLVGLTLIISSTLIRLLWFTTALMRDRT